MVTNSLWQQTACDFENMSDFTVDLDRRKHEPGVQDLIGIGEPAKDQRAPPTLVKTHTSRNHYTFLFDEF